MTKDEFLELAGKHYEEVNKLTDAPTFYDCEKSLYEFMLKVSGEIMEKQMSEGVETNNRRKKKR